MSTANSNHTATSQGADAARPERIRQGITAEAVGRLVDEPVVRDRSSSFSLAVNVPHRSNEGGQEGWKERTTYVNVLAIGDAHRTLQGGGLSDLQRGAVVSISDMALETDQRAGRTTLDGKITRPEQVTVLQKGRPRDDAG